MQSTSKETSVDKVRLIGKLNEAISLELGAAIQYNHYGQMVTGTEKRIWQDFFEDTSEEAFKHARKFGSRVVALGGTPSTEPEPTKQATDLPEMLLNSLAVERRAVQLYTEALGFCEDNAAYRNLLEEQIQTEQIDAEELEKYLGQIEKVEMAQPRRRVETA
jgi:bacterioferritin (cytochrome b1)